ncbi:MAG: hypothetical protein U0401_23495 [Anaerolineae bacterium]
MVTAAWAWSSKRPGQGAKFDAWGDWHNPVAWQEAFAEHGLDAWWYAQRPRLADEIFPWDHISAGVGAVCCWIGTPPKKGKPR